LSPDSLSGFLHALPICGQEDKDRFFLCTGFSELINQTQAPEMGIGQFVMKRYKVANFKIPLKIIISRLEFLSSVHCPQAQHNSA
jgi:hypothetical protein